MLMVLYIIMNVWMALDIQMEFLVKKFFGGYAYDPAVGDPDNSAAPGTPWDQVPESWVCPVCGMGKDVFEKE